MVHFDLAPHRVLQFPPSQLMEQVAASPQDVEQRPAPHWTAQVLEVSQLALHSALQAKSHFCAVLQAQAPPPQTVAPELPEVPGVPELPPSPTPFPIVKS